MDSKKRINEGNTNNQARRSTCGQGVFWCELGSPEVALLSLKRLDQYDALGLTGTDAL